ncbi:MAG: tetratricopeptide repeat protein [Prolixibacteraceae bacterium]|nr:tetratricopeptide repeat protein [Prolixibacteraceae bacterium]
MRNQAMKKNRQAEKTNDGYKPDWTMLKTYFEKKWTPYLLFLIVTLIAYSNSFDVPFQFDDDVQIVYRESNHSLEKFSEPSYWLNVNNRPVSSFTLTMNYIVNGENVTGYHVINFLIHLLTGFFLFLWLKLFIKDAKQNTITKALPLVITLFFLVNPVQTQSVTYIVQRMTSLSGMFFMLGLYLYTLGRKIFFSKGNILKSALLIFFSILAGILATYSKQNAAVFPLAFLLTDLFFIRNRKGKICIKYLVSIVAAGMLTAVFVLVKFGLPAETTEISRLDYLATQMFVIPRYIQMMLLPVGLSIDHGIRAAEGFNDIRVILGLLFLLGLVVLSIIWIKKRPLFSFGIFFMFIAFIVESSFLPIRDVMFDHRMYIALAGFSIAVWSLFFDFRERIGQLLSKWLIVVIMLGMTIGTFGRNSLWRDRIAIWEQVTRRYPDHPRGWIGYARMARKGGDRYDKNIILALNNAHRLDPGNEEVLLDLGLYYMKTKQVNLAMDAYNQLLSSQDNANRLLAQRAFVAYYLKLEKWDEAIPFLNEILQDYPDDENALSSLAGVYIRKKDFQNAAKSSKALLEKYPENRKGLFYCGKALFFLEERIEAKIYLEKLLQIEPNNVEALIMYGNACINTKSFDEAIKSFQKAYDLTNDPQMLQLIDFVNNIKSSY